MTQNYFLVSLPSVNTHPIWLSKDLWQHDQEAKTFCTMILHASIPHVIVRLSHIHAGRIFSEGRDTPHIKGRCYFLVSYSRKTWILVDVWYHEQTTACKNMWKIYMPSTSSNVRELQLLGNVTITKNSIVVNKSA